MASSAPSMTLPTPLAVLSPLSQDAEYWWHTTGRTLANLMYQAGYNIESLTANILFFRRFAVPWMGKRPTSAGEPQAWRSYVTDDHSPIEYSWSWSGGNGNGNIPKIRFTIEAMGDESGTARDPYNQSASRTLLSDLRRQLTGVDFTIHDHFANELLPTGKDSRAIDARAPETGHRSSIFIAFEMQSSGSSPTIKTYFMPMIRAIEMRQSRAETLIQAMNSFNRDFPNLAVPAFDHLTEFMRNEDLGSRCEVEMVAIDCIAPLQSRVKIYLRSQETSWNQVLSILTMNGLIPLSHPAQRDLREIWHLVLSLPTDFDPNASLRHCNRLEAGTFYCFYARPGEERLRCKLYIPAKYYGRNDRAIASGLEKCFQKRGQEGFVQRYWRVMEEMCAHRELEESCGLHSYISCEPDEDGEGELSITSYFSPEVYHSKRWRGTERL